MSRQAVQRKDTVLTSTKAAILLGVCRQTAVNMIRLYVEREEKHSDSWLYGWKQGSHYKTTQQAVIAYERGIYNYEPKG